MGLLKEFRDFIDRGNVTDLAIGVVIGGAFGNVVHSLVADILMPPLGLLTSGLDFKSLNLVLQKAYSTTDSTNATQTIYHPEIAIAYGRFVSESLSFFIIALAAFGLIQLVTGLRRLAQSRLASQATDEEKVALPADIQLLQEIRDLLAKQKS